MHMPTTLLVIFDSMDNGENTNTKSYFLWVGNRLFHHSQTSTECLWKEILPLASLKKCSLFSLLFLSWLSFRTALAVSLASVGRPSPFPSTLWPPSGPLPAQPLSAAAAASAAGSARAAHCSPPAVAGGRDGRHRIRVPGRLFKEDAEPVQPVPCGKHVGSKAVVLARNAHSSRV